MGRIGARLWQGRDVVRRLGLTLAGPNSLANDSTDLFHAGPADVIVQRGRGGDGPHFETTVAHTQSAGGLLFSNTLTVAVRGTKPPVRR